MSELKAEIEKSIEEEAADSEKYLKMAEEAGEEYACILREIAREELTHKKHLEAILADINDNK